jgi:hypothetical protein
VLDAAGALTNAVTVRSLYAEGHPAIAHADDAVAAAFARVLDAMPSVLVARVDEELVVCERPAPGLAERLHVLVEAMTRHEIECLVIQRGLTRAECETLARALASPADTPGTARADAQAGLVHVLLRFLGAGSGNVAQRSAAGVDETELVPLVRATLLSVERAVLADERIDRGITFSAARAVLSACQARTFLLDQRARAGLPDDDAAHAANVAAMSASMAIAARYPPEVCLDVTAAALLHDVGYALLPAEIRAIAEPHLDEEGTRRFRRHPQDGALALLLSGCPPLWIAAALEHHRGVDGEGFPALPSSAPPHELVRMVALANFVDRKRTRAGGLADDPDEVLRVAASLELRYFGSTLVRLFLGALGVFPAGTTVELSDRRPAMVTQVNPRDLLRPAVKLIGGPDAGKRLDLAETNPLEGRYELSIARAIPPPLLPWVPPTEAAALEPAEPEVDLVAPTFTPLRAPTVRAHEEAASVERLLESVLAPSEEERLPRRGTSEPPARPRSSEAPVSAPVARVRRSSVPTPPPAIVESPRPAPAPTPLGRRVQVSDLPAPMDPPAPPPAVDGLADELRAFLADDPSAPRPPARERRRPQAPAGLDAELRDFLGGAPPRAAPSGALVPVLRAAPSALAAERGLDPRAAFLLMFLDGSASIDEVLDACGLPSADARRILEDLVARGLVELRPRC